MRSIYHTFIDNWNAKHVVGAEVWAVAHVAPMRVKYWNGLDFEPDEAKALRATQDRAARIISMVVGKELKPHCRLVIVDEGGEFGELPTGNGF